MALENNFQIYFILVILLIVIFNFATKLDGTTNERVELLKVDSTFPGLDVILESITDSQLKNGKLREKILQLSRKIQPPETLKCPKPEPQIERPKILCPKCPTCVKDENTFDTQPQNMKLPTITRKYPYYNLICNETQTLDDQGKNHLFIEDDCHLAKNPNYVSDPVL